MYNATTKNTNYLHYPLAAVESLSLPCLVVLGVICALTKDGKQTCDLSNKEIQHRTGIRKSAATSAISELIKQKLIKVDISYTKNGGQKRTITLLTDAKLFSEQVNHNTADGSTAKQPTSDTKTNEGLPQNGKRVCRNTADGSTAKQPTPYRNTVDPYIYEEGRSKVERKVDLKGMNNSVEKSTQRVKTSQEIDVQKERPQTSQEIDVKSPKVETLNVSENRRSIYKEEDGSIKKDLEDGSIKTIKKENIKEKTGTAEQQENTDSMFLPQDLLPEELKQPELAVINSVNPLNYDADPQNIAINTLDGTNTHTDHRSPLKTKSERSEGVSVKPKRKRNTKNPEFDEQGHKIFYVKDNPPSLEQTADFMRNKANRFFDNLIKDGKATESDKDFLNAINIFDYAENCLNWYATRGWAQNNGDLLKDWAATCARWIGKDLNTEWSKYVRYRQFKHNSSGSNSGGYQRTYGETLDDFQGRVINQINRIGHGMFGNQNPELEYGQHNISNDGGNQSK